MFPWAAIMKMLFFSSDRLEVEQVSRQFTQAGIPCEIHEPKLKGSSHAVDTELWIQNDKDCHRALLLCVQLGIGFARRPNDDEVLDTPIPAGSDTGGRPVFEVVGKR